MNWTDDRIESLRKLWSEGFSASQISAQLGGVSRNAVIGKVHRLKLSSKGRTTASPARKKKPKPVVKETARVPKASKPRSSALVIAKPMVVKEYAQPQSIALMPNSRHLKLADLNEKVCKWPNGDPLAEDFSFCGTESMESGPYCRYHAKLAFQPASERRRSR